MSIISWLFPKAPSRRDEISELQSSIASNAQLIEATKPIVREAIKQTDDSYYRLRAKAGVTARRVAYEGSLMRDLTDGWRRDNG